jgi:hypothetical protein
MFLEIIFHLLNIYRKAEGVDSRRLRRLMKRRLVHPEMLEMTADLDYWIKLCQSAGLLDIGGKPYPTLLAGYWWGYPAFDQLDLLVKGWMGSVGADHRRKMRRVLLQRLRTGKELTSSEQKEASGLAPLGLIHDCQLTELGRSFLVEKKTVSDMASPQSWQFQDDRVVVPYPPNWGLLWDLETYLDPMGPGEYSLAAADLQRAAQRGMLGGNFHARQAKTLLSILELGFGNPIPSGLPDKFAAQPGLRVLSGLVLEASDPDLIQQLRSLRGLRPYLNQVLSPRHIHLSPWISPKLLGMLRQMGWEVDQTMLDEMCQGRLLETPVTRGVNEGKQYFTSAERAFILSLALFAAGFHAPYAPPPGLLRKLASGLAPNLMAAADEQANTLLEVLYPRPAWVPEITPPPLPEASLLDFFQGLIDREESIDILYQSSTKHTPEYRHISPLMLERRNERWYLTAYCHNRRGQRLFRLDRLKIVDFYDP